MDGDLMRARAAGAFTRPGRDGRVRLRHSAAAAAVGRWLMLLVALAGLMAMHGLSDHGVGGVSGINGMTGVAGIASSAGSSASTVVSSGVVTSDETRDMDPGHAGHAADGALAAGSSMTSPSVATHESSSEHSTFGAFGASAPSAAGHGGHGSHGGHGELLLGVCLAVLAAGLILRVLVGAFRPVGVFLTKLVDQAAAAGVAVRARARGPACPDLRLLSIQRC